MRSLPKVGMFLMALGVLTIGSIIFVESENVAAQPQYLKQFKEKYKDDLKKIDCKVCHPGKDKKERNVYGKALADALGEKKVKDTDKIDMALKKVEDEKNESTGKTFGEMIKEGTPPGDEK